MGDVLKLCLAQMTSTTRHGPNIAFMQDAAAQAAAAGCQMLALPEVSGLFDLKLAEDTSRVGQAADDPFIGACRTAAAQYGLWINTGSTPVAGPGGKFFNHGTFIDPAGAVVADYDKIHLFDIFLDGKAPSGESERYAPGSQTAMVDTPWGAMGMTICYDLRFPHLYRWYGKAGASVIFVPAAFTVATGQAHWHVLLRARAIENGCFIVAPAQVGKHDDGRRTYGHSVVVSPWGEVLCDMGDAGPGLAMVNLDMDLAAKAKRQIPSLRHDRAFEGARPNG